MKCSISQRILTGVVFATLLATLTALISLPIAGADGEQAALQSDRAFEDALRNADKSALGKLLDTNFAWTDADGKTRSKAEAIENISALATDNRGDTDVQTHLFGEVERIVGSHHNALFVRIWVKRTAGWRALIDIDTPIPAKGYSSHPSPPRASDKDCQNPCKILPYKPANQAQQAAVDTWLRLKMDEWHAVPDDWTKYTSDNLVIISPSQHMAKAERLALLQKQKEAYGDGSPSPAVESMKMYDFGNTVIMTALHAPGNAGKRAYAVRMFANENNAGWKIVLSAQTDIQLPPDASN
jgi:hypothetical protein